MVLTKIWSLSYQFIFKVNYYSWMEKVANFNSLPINNHFFSLLFFEALCVCFTTMNINRRNCANTCSSGLDCTNNYSRVPHVDVWISESNGVLRFV